jgi:capsular exopolysaccharide synthesis family protein
MGKADKLSDDARDGLNVEVRSNGVDLALIESYATEESKKFQSAGAHPNPPQPVVRPAVDSAVRSLSLPPRMENKLVIGRDISPLTIEQYRRLAAVLHQLQAEHGLKTIMVTSAAPAEGKTLTVTNLALTLSESYHQRVLLVDADLRRPSVHEVFGIQCGEGLAEVVVDRAHSLPVVELSPTLTVLTAGRRLSNPMAMLTSERMRAVISDAAAGFDWVLLDTPPVGLLPDAQLVARLSEGILFVIAAGATPYPLVKRAINELGVERLVGTVLNRVEERNLGLSDHYGSYYYGATGTGTTRRR